MIVTGLDKPNASAFSGNGSREPLDRDLAERVHPSDLIDEVGLRDAEPTGGWTLASSALTSTGLAMCTAVVPEAKDAYLLADKFATIDDIGPASVALE